MMTHNDSCPLPLLHPVLYFPVTSVRNRKSFFFLLCIWEIDLDYQSGTNILKQRTKRTHRRTMPSAEKILYYLSSALLTVIAVALLGYGMSAEWSSSAMACSPPENNFFNGSATIRLGLFEGEEFHYACPRFASDVNKVFGKLMRLNTKLIITKGQIYLLILEFFIFYIL